MKNLAKDFTSYKQFNIQHIAFAKPSNTQEISALRNIGIELNSLPEIVPSEPRYAIWGTAQAQPHLKILARDAIPNTLWKEIQKNVVKIAPTAFVYQIPENQPDLSQEIKITMTHFDYYFVRFGLVVLLNRSDQIPELRMEVNLESDAPDKTYVTCHDLVPDDTFKNINIISGKVTLEVSNALKFIPSPAAQIFSEIIKIDIDPFEIKWNIKKCQINAAGQLDYKLYWRLYGTSIAEDFEPAIILKVKKGVKKVLASAKLTYKLKTSWLITPEVRTTKIKIPVLPLN